MNRKEAFPAFQYHELLLSQKIIGELEKLYDIHYTALETEQFTILLCSHLLKIDYQKISLNNLEKMVGAKTYQLAQKVLNATNTTFFKNHSEDFFIRFTLHLKKSIATDRKQRVCFPYCFKFIFGNYDTKFLSFFV